MTSRSTALSLRRNATDLVPIFDVGFYLTTGTGPMPS